MSADESLVGTRPLGGSAAKAPLAKRKKWLFASFRSTSKGGDLLAVLILGDALLLTILVFFCSYLGTVARVRVGARGCGNYATYTSQRRRPAFADVAASGLAFRYPH